MSSPILSIIVPVYNAAPFLRDCIDSILNQTYTDFELILVNDGSTDESLEILKEYAVRYSHVKIINKPNGGVSSARNIGIEKAKSKFITFIDADDIIKPTYLSNFSYDENLDYEIQGMELVYVGMEKKISVINQSNTQVKSIGFIIAETELNRTARGPCLKLYKTEIIKRFNVTFKESISYGEDAIFVKEYLTHCDKLGRTIKSTDYLYMHRNNPNSLTKTNHEYMSLVKATKLDFELYLQLEHIFGPFSVELSYSFKKERTLELFASLCLMLCDKSCNKKEKKNRLRIIKSTISTISYKGKLPIVYRIVKFTTDNLPYSLSAYFNAVLLKITNRLHNRAS